MKKFVCSVCGYVAEGKIPEECPVCHAKADKFVAMQEGKREWRISMSSAWPRT